MRMGGVFCCGAAAQQRVGVPFLSNNLPVTHTDTHTRIRCRAVFGPVVFQTWSRQGQGGKDHSRQGKGWRGIGVSPKGTIILE